MEILHGNLFDSKLNYLVNPVNCVGVMGKGLAKEFKLKYPDMFNSYNYMCKYHKIKIGKPVIWENPNADDKNIILFPTKNHWRSASQLEWIEEGMQYFIDNIYDGNNNAAFPLLGAGLRGLNTIVVFCTIKEYLKDTDCEIWV